MSAAPGRREVAYRLFAAEFQDADYDYSESDEDRAPNFVVTPTGARVNRLFVAGVLTEVEDVNPEMVRARVVDPTGAFVVYAGQYQPDELAFLEQMDPPGFLAVTGKARTFQPEDSELVYTSIRPESINAVDATTRDRWVVAAAERTIERIGLMASAIAAGLSGDELRAALEAEGVDERLADGVALALEHYGTTPAYLRALRKVATDAVRVVADELEEVDRLEVAPDEGEGDASELATLDLTGASTAPTAATPGPDSETATAESTDPGRDTPASEPAATDDATAPTAVEQAGEATTGAEAEAGEPDEPGEFDPGDFELDEETREEIVEEHGTEFATADEVDDPGTADIESSEPAADPDEPLAAAADAEPTVDEADERDEAVAESPVDEEPAAAEDADDVDLEAAVLAVMQELDDGDGADREEVVTRVADAHGASTEAVEDALQDLLMSGQCYEPQDGTVKPI